MKGTGAKRNVCPDSCVSTGAKFPVAPVESAPMQASICWYCNVRYVGIVMSDFSLQPPAGAAEPMRHWGEFLTKIWPGEAREARCRACLISFCHSISIYTSIYCHLWHNILVCKLKKHYNWQSKCGYIFVWRLFSIVKYVSPVCFFGIQILPNSITAGGA